MSELTEADRKILQLLQSDARTRLEAIATETGTSTATVQRRIREMKQTGVIDGDICVVNPDSVGYTLTFLILVELERESIHQLDAFRRKMKSDQQIQQCYYITGDADFALIAIAKDMEDFQLLTQRLFFDDSNVKKFRTSVVMDRTKVSLTVPVQSPQTV